MSFSKSWKNGGTYALTIYDGGCFKDLVPTPAVLILAGGHIRGDMHRNEGFEDQKVRVEVGVIILVRTKAQMSLASVQDLKLLRLLIIMF